MLSSRRPFIDWGGILPALLVICVAPGTERSRFNLLHGLELDGGAVLDGPGGQTRIPGLPEVTPIVPVPGELQFDDPAYLFEPKYDGFRGLLYVGPRHCWFRSKAVTP